MRLLHFIALSEIPTPTKKKKKKENKIFKNEMTNKQLCWFAVVIQLIFSTCIGFYFILWEQLKQVSELLCNISAIWSSAEMPTHFLLETVISHFVEGLGIVDICWQFLLEGISEPLEHL